MLEKDALKRVESSFDPKKREPPADAAASRLLVQKMLDALPSCERRRLDNLAWSVSCSCVDTVTVYDRIYAALATAADLQQTSPGALVEVITTEHTSVGYIMMQSGSR